MKILPSFFRGIILSFALFTVLLIPKSSFAASAYISPATGFITSNQPMVSLYVESSATEPEMSAVNLKITYPASLKVTEIIDGDFDSYLEKNDNDTVREITINAVNTAGNFKSGNVKVASIRFETITGTGEAQLVISSNSEIIGASGEQLLTETINGVYTLAVETTPADTPEETTTPAVGGTEETTTTETPAVPETGISDMGLYLGISVVLIALGLGVYLNPLVARQNS